jgi:predicted ATP-grasp superfamily ATP-dependent carboligase
MGNALAGEFSLRGAFGVDFLVHDGRIAPVDLNPRWTASVEVLERALGWNGFAMNAERFAGSSGSRETAGDLGLKSRDFNCKNRDFGHEGMAVAKAILFAAKEVKAPRLARNSVAGCELFDLPAAGTKIGAGEPIVSVIVEAKSASDREIEGMLREATRDTETLIYAS